MSLDEAASERSLAELYGLVRANRERCILEAR